MEKRLGTVWNRRKSGKSKFKRSMKDGQDLLVTKIETIRIETSVAEMKDTLVIGMIKGTEIEIKKKILVVRKKGVVLEAGIGKDKEGQPLHQRREVKNSL